MYYDIKSETYSHIPLGGAELSDNPNQSFSFSITIKLGKKTREYIIGATNEKDNTEIFHMLHFKKQCESAIDIANANASTPQQKEERISCVKVTFLGISSILQVPILVF